MEVVRKKPIVHLELILFLVFILIPLGASVRAMNAGLACPDWPLCFGDVIPDYQPQVYFEFIHRVLAGIVGIYFALIAFLTFRSNEVSGGTKVITSFAFMVLVAQVILGALTVTMHLDEYIVAAHLSLGTGFYALLTWIYASMRGFHNIGMSKSIKTMSIVSMLAVYGQIILGGLVASHYAALACTDFPLCHGQFIPTLSGVVGLHVIHRLGAYALTGILITYILVIFKNSEQIWLRRYALFVFALIVTQIGIGIANVLLYRPPLITVLHLAVGTALLGATTYMCKRINS